MFIVAEARKINIINKNLRSFGGCESSAVLSQQELELGQNPSWQSNPQVRRQDFVSVTHFFINDAKSRRTGRHKNGGKRH